MPITCRVIDSQEYINFFIKRINIYKNNINPKNFNEIIEKKFNKINNENNNENEINNENNENEINENNENGK